MRREDFKDAACVIRGNVFGKPDLNRVVWEGQTLMVKDVKDKPFLFRWTVGISHADIPLKEQAAVDLTPSLVRLSVGIESKVDLQTDLYQAFRKTVRE